MSLVWTVFFIVSGISHCEWGKMNVDYYLDCEWLKMDVTIVFAVSGGK